LDFSRKKEKKINQQIYIKTQKKKKKRKTKKKKKKKKKEATEDRKILQKFDIRDLYTSRL